MVHHTRGLRGLLKSGDLADRVAEDFEKAGLDERRLEMLRYAAKLTRTPGAMTKKDVDRLRAAGFADEDVLAIVEVTGYYAYANRIVDGLGVELVELDAEGGHST